MKKWLKSILGGLRLLPAHLVTLLKSAIAPFRVIYAFFLVQYRVVKGNGFLTSVATGVVIVSSIIFLMYRFDRPMSPWQDFTPAHRQCAELDVFSLRLETYQARLGLLDSNLKLQGLFAVIALAVMTSRRASLQVPVFQINIPTRALFLLLPLISLFLWLQFGYLLSHLIESRISLFHLAAELSPQAIGLKQAKVYGVQVVLNDGGFLDAWFRAFHPECAVGFELHFVNRLGNAVALFVVYGALLGAGHAAILYTLYLGSKRNPEGVVGSIHLTVLWVVGVIMALTHVQFYVANANQNWQHIGIGAFLLLFVVALHASLEALQREAEEEPASPG